MKRETLIALKTDEVFGVTSYRIEDDQLNYVLSGGASGSAPVEDVDWTRTSELNTERATSAVYVSRAY